jgi:hypothetical protein
MSKRRENTSRYDKRGNAIVWQITLVFLLETDFSMPDLLSYDAALKKLSPKDTNRRMVGFHVKDVRDSVLVGDMLKQVLSSLPVRCNLDDMRRPRVQRHLTTHACLYYSPALCCHIFCDHYVIAKICMF